MEEWKKKRRMDKNKVTEHLLNGHRCKCFIQYISMCFYWTNHSHLLVQSKWLCCFNVFEHRRIKQRMKVLSLEKWPLAMLSRLQKLWCNYVIFRWASQDKPAFDVKKKTHFCFLNPSYIDSCKRRIFYIIKTYFSRLSWLCYKQFFCKTSVAVESR